VSAADRAITACRVCGGADLVPVLNLGRQAFTGIFPRTRQQEVGTMPLVLVKCMDGGDPARCGLVQLRHTGDLAAMYGGGYGYRSGLNRAMVSHLQGKVAGILDRVALGKGDLVIDIGSNDGTTLAAYPEGGADLVGIDPTGARFAHHYPAHARMIPEFFSADVVRAACGARRAKVITSFSMFYDLEAPLAFMRQVHECLEDRGLWVLEQSYLPTMLEMNSYDTVCHEHLEYYGLRQIDWMMGRAGFRVLDVEFNAVNGGSFSVVAAKKGSPDAGDPDKVRAILAREAATGLHTLAPFEAFRARVARHRDEIRGFLREAKAAGRTVYGYGASTKGNVLLQYCGVTAEEVPFIAEVNADKFGCFTPGTLIPIIPEDDARRAKPDYFLVLPWHFRDGILERERAFLDAGGRFLFPLPKIDVVGRG
jgi:NDP-4-keto-2,6-dideoxyhexose 3-C-methyltransferase